MAIAPEQAPDEHLTSFLLPGLGVRGAILRAHAGVAGMLEREGLTGGVQRCLGELMAAAPLMAGHLKHDMRLALQIQQAAAWSLLLVQVQRHVRGEAPLRLRGMVRPRAEGGAASAVADAQDFARLSRGGRFAVTLEQLQPGSGPGNYQALVPLNAPDVARALEGYFLQSEQLPTRFVLAASPGGIAGLMLQRLPGSGGVGSGSGRGGSPQRPAGNDHGEGWAHAGALIDTVAADELLAVRPAVMLHRLFHADDLQLHAPCPLHLACSCSQARISRMLLSLGEKEVGDILEEQGQVEVCCDFCGTAYRYDAAQVQSLFEAQARTDAGDPGSQTRH